MKSSIIFFAALLLLMVTSEAEAKPSPAFDKIDFPLPSPRCLFAGTALGKSLDDPQGLIFIRAKACAPLRKLMKNAQVLGRNLGILIKMFSKA